MLYVGHFGSLVWDAHSSHRNAETGTYTVAQHSQIHPGGLLTGEITADLLRRFRINIYVKSILIPTWFLHKTHKLPPYSRHIFVK